jgi:ferredoxin
MIISAKKPLEEVKEAAAPYKTLGIIGCGGCAAVCQTGGTKQVEELAEHLDDKEIAFTFQIDEPCDRRILSRELRRISKRLENVDALIVLACGIGVQTVASEAERPCLAGLDTVFPGTVAHADSYMENCVACGECVLNMTASICPRALCPKGILNGPCSEKIDESCSVDSDAECVWVSIAKRRESLGLPVVELEFTPMDWMKRVAPRRISGKRDPAR